MIFLFALFGLLSPRQAQGITFEPFLFDERFCELVERVTNFFFWVMMPLGLVVLFYAAWLYMTAGGESAKINSAKQALFYAIIGIGLAIISLGIVEILADFFEIDPGVCGI